MQTVSNCLTVSAWLYIALGAILDMTVSTYMLIPCFMLAFGVVAVIKGIEAEKRIAAWIGVVLLSLYSVSLFFFLGIPGLVAAYRARDEWTRWA
jgi:hypothetical protein